MGLSGSSDEEDKLFPIIITHEDVHTGLVTTSFIDMAVVNMATCENITTAMKKSLGDVGLDLISIIKSSGLKSLRALLPCFAAKADR
jgi:hypothetical protein